MCTGREPTVVSENIPQTTAPLASLSAMPRPVDADRGAFATEVCNLVDGLSPEIREAVVLVYFRGLSQADAARALRLPLATVRTFLSTGLSKLAGQLTSAV
jgi:DNA-directed RNA polymerase specialized sigma24 family protein